MLFERGLNLCCTDSQSNEGCKHLIRVPQINSWARALDSMSFVETLEPLYRKQFVPLLNKQ